ncbi:MAG: YceI family protein [Acidimicrobiales bacterium]
MFRRRTILIAAVAVFTVAIGGGLYWFLDDNAPSAVSLDAAAATVGPSDPATEASSSGGAATDLSGIWIADTSTGGFDYDSATGSFVGFRIEERLASIGSATAVGRTGDITGSITIEGATLTEAAFEIDLTTITTNEGRRDDAVQNALETDQYPTARFELTERVELGDTAADGDAVAVSAIGDLTIHGLTRSVQIDLDAQVVDDTIVVVGSTEVSFADYDIAVPSSPIVLSVDDDGILELQLLLVQQ